MSYLTSLLAALPPSERAAVHRELHAFFLAVAGDHLRAIAPLAAAAVITGAAEVPEDCKPAPRRRAPRKPVAAGC